MDAENSRSTIGKLHKNIIFQLLDITANIESSVKHCFELQRTRAVNNGGREKGRKKFIVCKLSDETQCISHTFTITNFSLAISLLA